MNKEPWNCETYANFFNNGFSFLKVSFLLTHHLWNKVALRKWREKEALINDKYICVCIYTHFKTVLSALSNGACSFLFSELMTVHLDASPFSEDGLCWPFKEKRHFELHFPIYPWKMIVANHLGHALRLVRQRVMQEVIRRPFVSLLPSATSFQFKGDTA